MVLNWTARNLAGKLVEDKRELGVEFDTTKVDHAAVGEIATEPLGHSPYVTATRSRRIAMKSSSVVMTYLPTYGT